MTALVSACSVVKQRVLFIVPSLRRAGAENQLVSLVNALPGGHFEKHLLTYRSEDDLKADVNCDEVTIHALHRQFKFDLSLAKSIGKIIDDNEIDVLHCTLQNAMLYGFMGRFFANRRPLVVTVIHTTENADFKHSLADWVMYRPLLKRCKQVWFVSAIQADRWVKKFPFLKTNLRVIHNGIDLARFDPSSFHDQGQAFRQKLNIDSEQKVLCCVAGFRSEKLHSVLIDAMAKICVEHPHVCLLLAGVGPTQSDARDQVSTLGLQKNIIFLDGVRDVRALLAASDVKILASAAETFSMAMLEAMAMQVPVISTSVGGAAEAIKDDWNGCLVQPGDVGELVESIQKLITNHELCRKMGARARDTVISRFGVKSMIDRSAEELLNMSVIAVK